MFQKYWLALLIVLLCFPVLGLTLTGIQPAAKSSKATGPVKINEAMRKYRTTTKQFDMQQKPGTIQCANLIYGNNKTSVCFSDEFLAEIRRATEVKVNRRFIPVKLQSSELFLYPFVVMTGDSGFSLSDDQVTNMRQYLKRGGFIIASAGCSSDAWNTSFEHAMKQVYPDVEMTTLPKDHPVYSTVYDLNAMGATPELKGLVLEGRVVLIFSDDGLNDTSNAGPNCCCCGGHEITKAKEVNVNIMAYALTH